MHAWYLNHEASLQIWGRGLLQTDALLLLSAAMYAIFAVGLLSLGTKHHAAVVRGESEVGQFPEGYFTMLAVQLIPLTITGFLLADAYIISTRVVTLIVVLVVYAMTISDRGSFNTKRHLAWAGVWLAIAILGPMLWVKYPVLQTFVHDWETWIAWSSVLIMILFVIKGQLQVAKALFRHFLEGNYTVKRFNLQVVRFFGFLLQAVHYWFVPTKAKAFFGFDPIFLQGALGACGVAVVLGGALIGMIRGTHARHDKKDEARAAT